MNDLQALRPEGTWAATISKQNVLIGPFHTQRRGKGRDRRVPLTQVRNPARAASSRVISGRSRCRCRIEPSPKWRSDGS